MNTSLLKGGQLVALALAAIVALPFFAAPLVHADSLIKLPAVSVDIGARGDVEVSGAKVTSVNNASVNAETKWGSSILGWTLRTDDDTKFTAAKGEHAGLASIAVGDILSFKGSLIPHQSGFAVEADHVQEWSVSAKQKFTGVVQSINTTLNSFVIEHGAGTTTVQTSSSTSIKKHGNAASFADIMLNAKIKLIGYWNGSVFNATEVNIGGARETETSEAQNKHELRSWIRNSIYLKMKGE